MAETAKSVFPFIAASNWWKIRGQIKQVIPRSGVTASYVSSILGGMSEASATKNVIRPLKTMGIIDDDGRVTEVGNRWRDDQAYQEVCREILESVYPDSLVDVAPPPSPNAELVQRWFVNTARFGEASARNYVETYMMLATGELNPSTSSRPKQQVANNAKSSGKRVSVPQKNNSASIPSAATIDEKGESEGADSSEADTASFGKSPSLHIDVQIHISADSTDKQIESIFRHMSQYLYGGKPIG